MKKLLISGVILAILGLPVAQVFASGPMTCWFPPAWQTKPEKAQAIVSALSSESGLSIQPKIAGSYPEILTAFASDEETLVYIGSFVQAIINARGLGNALVQSQNGKEFYSGIMIYPSDLDPKAVLQNHPREIAYAVGASSGESTAKAATAGQAALPMPSHGASCQAILDGKARAAVVKNWWWEANREKFPGLSAYEIPSYSYLGNPDNVLTASSAVPKETREKLIVAALKHQAVFDAKKIRLFDNRDLQFSLWLMEKGKIDPLTYGW